MPQTCGCEDDCLNNSVQQTPNNYSLDDEIDLRELFGILWHSRWLIIASALLAGILAAGISLQMPNIYRAQALLTPAEESRGGGLAALAGQFGGLASLAGVNIPEGEANKTTIAIEVLKSRAFAADFVRRREIAVPLMAGEKWDVKNNQLIIDPKRYDVAKQQWIVDETDSKSGSPTDWDIYEKIVDIMKVERDKKTGLVTISLDFLSPSLAQQWVSWLIEDVNAQVRQMDVDEATKSIEYLNQQLQKTSVKEMQQIFYQLIEKQTQTIMLANVRSQYAFKVIDPPVVAQEKQSPRRALIVLVAMVTAGGLCGLGVLIKGPKK